MQSSALSVDKVLVVEPQRYRPLDAQTLPATLCSKAAERGICGRIVRIAPMPLAGAGKIDKNRRRAEYGNGKLDVGGSLPWPK
ncbi:hypothetical protein [Phenylobacterium sp.]|uniref:hypothetical protein n=1 Tax=Phenylobacterium sp. TaxID=1871053 RepID=UPI0011F4ED52|nr:hypothetical protein [Phenylobacterium sp.]THD59642.1 MAG: hypothetical protein E8A12_11465 [Phenylobacterium sp.]